MASTFANNWRKKKNVLSFFVHQKNAIKVASNATCLLKYFVGRQEMWVMSKVGGCCRGRGMPAVESRRTAAAAAAADCDKCDKDMCKICFMCLIIAFYGPYLS